MGSRMLHESLAAPGVVRQLLQANGPACAALGQRLRAQPPAAVLTLARGSSDHAASYAAYLVMARLGRLVTSLPMSLLTLYDSRLPGEGTLSLAFSQSGQSPDLVEPTRRLRASGATTVAFVNAEGSPLAAAAEQVLPLHAGEERSVAATKSCLAQFVAGAQLVAAWQDDDRFAAALAALPETMDRAAARRWADALPALATADRLYVVGRGPGLAVAAEAALKFKETCGIQAEAFSGAEVQHGPMALVGEGYPVLVMALRGPAQPGLLALSQTLAARGARVWVVMPEDQSAPPGTVALPLEPAPLADLDPVTALQSFYPWVEALSRGRGRDPDAPPHLAKVTRTT